MPHLCVHGGNGEYLRVEFVTEPDRMIAPSEGTYATIRFMYEPQASYHALTADVSFDVREGGRVVGAGPSYASLVFVELHALEPVA